MQLSRQAFVSQPSSRSIARLFVTLLTVAIVTGLFLPTAQGQGELVADHFSNAPQVESEPVVYSHDGTTELCFASSDIAERRELYCYDGSLLTRVTDIQRQAGSRPSDLAVYDDGSGPKLYFQARESSSGSELWSYDGSSVIRVADINTGSFNSQPRDLTVYDDGSGAKLYFQASNGGDGRELWSYDGSIVDMEADIHDSGSSLPQGLTVYDGGSGAKLYFQADDGSNGDELWSYDGSSANLEADIHDSGDSNPQDLTVYDDGSGAKLYFRADDGSNGDELWSYDGSSANLEADINDSGDSGPVDVTVYDDGSGPKLYFGASDGNDGRELWSFNGSNANLEADINDSGDSNPVGLTVYDDGSGPKLYFGATDGSAGEELWSYDGSSATLEADLIPGSLGSAPGRFTVYDDGSGERLFFSGDLYSKSNRLHAHSSTDTSPVSTAKNPTDGPSEKVVYDGTLYFSADDGSNGEELWFYDGSSFGRVEDINPGLPGSHPRSLTIYDDGGGAKLYFQADDGSSGRELWSFDGSTVSRAADINTGSGSSSPDDLTVYNDGSGAKLYFEADDGNSGRELWSYDGSIAVQETHIVDSGDSEPSDLTVYNDGSGAKLYFEATDGIGTDGSGYELWSYDGSTAMLEADISSGFLGSQPSDLTVYDDGSGAKLYFEADDGNSGDELWSYDGSNASLEANINDTGASFPKFLTVFDDGSGPKLFFEANDGISGNELWVYDGTNASLEADLHNSGSSRPADLTSFGGYLYFTAYTPQDGREPRAYDGSDVNSVDLYSGSFNGGGLDPVVYDDGSGEMLYVTATDGQSGAELFRFGPNDGPLPVELISFEGTQTDGSDVELRWTTAAEQNSTGFEIQRRRQTARVNDSADRSRASSTDWKTAGFVKSEAESGTSSKALSYRFTAQDLAVGTHQFRLTQIDTDGTTEIHEPVSVKIGMSAAQQLRPPAPNPVSDQSTVSFAVKENVETRVTLYNLLGQKVATLYEGVPPTEEETILQLDATALSSGTYFLRLHAGNETKTQRVTVVR